MASIRKRERKDGTCTFQVRWILGGRRGGDEQFERFSDEDQAMQFKKLVDAHGQQWPVGWVPGRGFVEPETTPDDVPLLQWAHRYVDDITGIDERTRRDYRREVDRHLSLVVHTRLDGAVLPATIGNLSKGDVQRWVRAEQLGEKDPDDPERWVRRKARPKSIHNRHGLLWCIVQAGKEAGLRDDNPLDGSYLPRTDDGTEEMVFLEPDEYQRLRTEFTDPWALDLADWLVGTGMRWGEATALQVGDINWRDGSVSVQRAWKRAEDNTFFLGPPKTRKARRTLALTGAQMDTVRRLATAKRPEALLFTTSWGNRWRHSNYYHRKWKPAVDAAVAKGLPRRPRIHDLRHTHVAWLIAGHIPLPAIQARLGHESIQTTVDRYGHLLRQMDEEITAALTAAMAPPAAVGLHLVRGTG
ncbi:tyrosine-type recombinase/integrase [Streptomyces sp. URMC 129]|uniref:tyrosine-type recombinase/integrase n=1 Tax=Streptomyces sp. URMC 129 TaxID=3423407 RepID=UPI003F1CFDCD